jgi:PII-like signaling protein
VSDDSLKLTAYFGERKRADHRFVAEALLDLFARRKVSTSILLRGVEGFGIKHHLRTDSSLTLSEDLPAVAVAVDTRPRIEALLEESADICQGALLTLERARLFGDDERAVTAPAALGEETKLTVYLGRHDKVEGAPAYAAVCELLRRDGISGASTLLGVDGTVRGVRERARFFGGNTAVPTMVIAVGASDLIARVLPDVSGLVRNPLLTLERIQVCKRDGALLSTPHPLPGTDEHGLAMWQKLMIYTSESQLWHGQPLHRAITRRLRKAGAAGATTLRGIWGYHGAGAPHGDRTWQFGRRVPTVTIAIDTPQRTANWFQIVDELTGDAGLVTSEMVPALRAGTGDHGQGGLRLARHRY